MAPERAPTSPAQRCYITPEGGALNPSGRRQPVPDRTLGAQGQRPGGAINPHARKGVSTFGNTGKHRAGPGPDPDRAERRLNPQARRACPYGVSLTPSYRLSAINSSSAERALSASFWFFSFFGTLFFRGGIRPKLTFMGWKFLPSKWEM